MNETIELGEVYALTLEEEDHFEEHGFGLEDTDRANDYVLCIDKEDMEDSEGLKIEQLVESERIGPYDFLGICSAVLTREGVKQLFLKGFRIVAATRTFTIYYPSKRGCEE